MLTEYLNLGLWIFVILLIAVVFYLIHLKYFHKLDNPKDFKTHTTSFLTTILGTTVGFALVTVSTIYFERINDKEEVITLLATTFRELDINYKVLQERAQPRQQIHSQWDMEVQSRFRVEIPIQFRFIDQLYQNENTYKYLSDSFANSRVVIIYRGVQHCINQIESTYKDEKTIQIKKQIANLAQYKEWVNEEGLEVAGSNERWNNSVKIFETWDQLTSLYSD